MNKERLDDSSVNLSSWILDTSEHPIRSILEPAPPAEAAVTG